ncbi:uncharacterized protein LOC113227562 [Hyposmocoma kahamanoa]|uniref:uncharacterized protein LOC113227562 n=1 Tax=Hyposmocoma kahamanoa TaxID=1477025 RepID=UPI000E6DA587|nr:uncharacterized protein LOC113227562 [Hyposmocoma kahamanoa]
MDSLKELLESWNIPQVVVTNFIENGIMIEHFPKLKLDNLKELCPHMGTRLSLEEKIGELITAQATTDAVSESTDDQVIITPTSSKFETSTSDCLFLLVFYQFISFIR